MINRQMVMACVLARVEAEGRDLSELSQNEIGALIADAVADLRLADDIVNRKVEARAS